MILGILSDTHDRVDAAAAAIAALKAAGAEYFLHCGDVGGEGVLDQLAGLRAAFVWGNNDWDRTSLERYAQDLGILSDTHDRVDAAAVAVAALKAAGAEYFLHCGDVGGEGVLDQLAGLPAAFVWGNNDWDRAALQRYALELGIECFGGFGELERGDKVIAITHGDDARAVRRVLDGQEHDYLFLGHSHVKADERVGRVRVINPGALHRAREKTVATLDTATDTLRFITIRT